MCLVSVVYAGIFTSRCERGLKINNYSVVTELFLKNNVSVFLVLVVMK